MFPLLTHFLGMGGSQSGAPPLPESGCPFPMAFFLGMGASAVGSATPTASFLILTRIDGLSLVIEVGT